MLTLAVVAVSTTPVQPGFQPMREHSWHESVATAQAIEVGNGATPEQAEPPADATFLRYQLATDALFEFIALGFDETGLAQIIYPLHLPAREGEHEKPLDNLPAKFDAVRSWLIKHYGTPVFTSVNDQREALFEDVETLVEQPTYRFFYTWCTLGANVFLNAQRSEGSSPVVVTSVESPHRPENLDDVEMGHGCTAGG